MNLARTAALLLMVSLVMPVHAGLGCCEPMDVEISLSQQRELDAAAERRYQKKRDAERAQKLAIEELETQRYQAALIEQQYELSHANQRQRQERRDAELAARIAQQEVEMQRRRDEAEEARRGRQERLDKELAERIARQELETARRTAQAEQQRLLDEVEWKAKQERKDAELAARIAQQELDMQRRRVEAEQRKLLAESERKAKQERDDADLARRIAQQDLVDQRQLQIAADAALAQQLYEEEFRNVRPHTRSKSKSDQAKILNQSVELTNRSVVDGVLLTTALPALIDTNSLGSWLRVNDVLPSSLQVDDALCVVCLSSSQDLKKEQVIKFPCKHVFCRSCVQGLIANKTGNISCPTCRGQVKVSAVKSIIG